MNRQRKQQANLNRRRADYSTMMDTRSQHGGVQQRKDTGGYHRPGSNKK